AREQALALAPHPCRHRRPRPVRPHPGARRARLGHHPGARAAAGRADHRQARQGLVLRDRPRADAAHARPAQHRAQRHHHRRVRAHHHGRGEGPRLRVPAARGLLRRDRPRQSPRGGQDGEDAGRRVRLGVRLQELRGEPAMNDASAAVTTPIRAPSLQTIGMTKIFGPLVALDDVSIMVEPGSFHALLGENGAGKSTLVKCIMGFYSADKGEVLLDDKPTPIRNPRDARAAGIGMVYQHFTLVPSLTGAENLVISRADAPAVIDWKKETRALEAFLDRMPFRVPLDVPVSTLAAGEKQKLEILKLLYLDQRLLILDEPTSVLTPDEADEMLGLLRGMAQRKDITVIMITHKFREVRAFADDVTVLRRGKRGGGGKVSELTTDAMARMMIGDTTIRDRATRADPAPGDGGLDLPALY